MRAYALQKSQLQRPEGAQKETTRRLQSSEEGGLVDLKAAGHRANVEVMENDHCDDTEERDGEVSKCRPLRRNAGASLPKGLGLFLLQHLGIESPIAHEKNDAILFRKTIGVVGLAPLLIPIGPDRKRRVLLALLGV